ncbi:pro-neuregulin-1, membrane-bound isoform isoform X3 [Pangasianodon hypophthalmus]|uniref:pro-neuregulin-1, membrane-bound isoform isoform X3 n=1 Tax=Pangasianodon hypophthalmus TaxID=310915 RepID=UPI0023080923|nr:pro-neuregulin-1, membrane-bound isoform isoform X3 [Pangasianodon hypophthalmus]
MRLLCVICGLLTSLSVCECGKPDCFSIPVRDLALHAGVVFEGVLEESPERPGYKTEPFRVDGVPDPGAELHQSRIRVHRVWEIKTGGLRKDAVVFLIWSREDKCFRVKAGTRYVFFTQPTGDASVLRAHSPPVQSKRAVRKDITHVLCQTCATPKLKKLTNVKVEEGQKVTLKCELLAGGKQTKIEWYQNGIKIGKNETRKIKLKKRGALSELQLMKVTDSDVGTYTCKAVNDRGEDTQIASVQVMKAPTSTTASAKTSSHMTRCKEEEKSYCVNGGECLTVNVTPNSTKHLCRCPNEFTGDRCQTYVMASFYKHHGIEFMEAEELYQKRILTITGICIALLVVGIMCVVAYCKTKKQRQKLHDRLRQSLRKRNAMADIGNGPQYPQNFQQPPQSLQLVNQYASKNTVPAQHVIEKETETSFTLSQYTSPTQPSTAITANLSQCWSNKKPENVVSDSRVISGVQNSRNGTPSHRGRLNATGGVRDVNACVKTSRETTDSYKDSPYSERYVSTVTTPTRLSPVKSLSPATPSSPPSEVSAPLPSLATSIPSMAMSPSGEEERPLLFLTPPRLREKSEPSRAQQLRNSAHYNHGLDEMSPPPSPLHIQEDEQHESMQEDSSVPCAPPTSAPHSPTAMHNSKRTKAGSQNSQDEQSGSSSESSSSESEAEEERMAEDTPFLIQNAGVASMAMLGLELVDSSRTNAALRLSPQDDLQSRLASVMANQDPIAV